MEGSPGWRPVVVGLAAATASWAMVRSGRAERLDARLGERLAQPRGRAADVVVAAATDLGSVYAVAGISGALGARGRRRAAGSVLVAGLAAWGAAQAAKPLLPRARPYQTAHGQRLVAEPAGTSWPSGHAAVAASVAAVLAPRLSRRARLAVATASLAVGWSRTYVGVHHPTDVVAGLGLGCAVGAALAGWSGAASGPSPTTASTAGRGRPANPVGRPGSRRSR